MSLVFDEALTVITPAAEGERVWRPYRIITSLVTTSNAGYPDGS